MIIHSLAEYYRRKVNAGDSAVAPFGWEYKEIPYIIALDANGYPVDVYSTVTGTGKDKKARAYLVPKGVIRSSNLKANLLWDNPEYIAGVIVDPKSEERHETFKRRVEELGNIPVPAWQAVQKFLSLSIEEKQTALRKFANWENACNDKKNANVTFNFDGSDAGIILEEPAIVEAINHAIFTDDADAPVARCIVANRDVPVAKLHPKIKNIAGAKKTPNLVSFNCNAFCSFGKTKDDQGYNAPIGQQTVFEYTEGLNLLLQKRMIIGETSTVFWADKPCNLEKYFGVLGGQTLEADSETSPPSPAVLPVTSKKTKRRPPKKDNPDNVDLIKQAYDAIYTGAYLHDVSNVNNDASKNRFYVLGLTPNEARLVVRFWHIGTVSEISRNIIKYFDDMRIVHAPEAQEHISLNSALLAVTSKSQRKNRKFLEQLSGDLIRAILENRALPRVLFEGAIARTRAEQKITRPRAAIIKAYINRAYHAAQFTNDSNNQWEKIDEMLDESKKNRAYWLGALFATFEKAQNAALPGINATIFDRFYGTASMTPGVVFPSLLRLYANHLVKLKKEKPALAQYFDNIVGETILKLDSNFDNHLSLENQGQFAIGYYQQKFHKKADPETTADEATE